MAQNGAESVSMLFKNQVPYSEKALIYEKGHRIHKRCFIEVSSSRSLISQMYRCFRKANMFFCL